MSLDEFAEKAHDVMHEMYTKAVEMGGEISGEHGIGHSKVASLRMLPEKQRWLLCRVSRKYSTLTTS